MGGPTIGAACGPDFKQKQCTINGGCKWTGPVYPNQTSDTPAPSCIIPREGWLFNIRKDPSEHSDVAAANPDMYATLLKRSKEIDATQIEFVKVQSLGPNAGKWWRGHGDTDAACKQAVSQGGVWGPHLP